MKKVRSLRAPVWRGESMGDSPAVVETKMRVRIARRRSTSVSLSWVYGLRCLDFGPSSPFNVSGLRPFRWEPNVFVVVVVGYLGFGPNINITKIDGKKKKFSIRSILIATTKSHCHSILFFFSPKYH